MLFDLNSKSNQEPMCCFVVSARRLVIYRISMDCQIELLKIRLRTIQWVGLLSIFFSFFFTARHFSIVTDFNEFSLSYDKN